MATRVERQERNRAKILAAARDEFLQRGWRDAKIDAIAARAELTRGAVYSNFSGKQALYLSALADRPPAAAPETAVADAGQALEAIARAHVTAMPLDIDEVAGRLDPDLVPQLLTGGQRLAYSHLLKLQTLLLSLGLERLAGHEASHDFTRMVTMALTILRGASATARVTPGLSEPFDVVASCRALASMETPVWQAPPVRLTPHATDEDWQPSPGVDTVSQETVDLGGDGVIGFFGIHRLNTVDSLIRGANGQATVVLVTGDAAESGPLIGFVLDEARRLLRQGIPPASWPRVRVVFDDTARLSSEAGMTAVSDATEVAVRIAGGRITARAEGSGAGRALTVATGDRVS